MNIRPAIPLDVPAVLPMVEKVCAFHEALDSLKFGFRKNVSQMYDDWLRKRASDPRSVFLVADRGNALVGFLIGTVVEEIPVYRLREFGFIHDLWVEPDYRNEGIARQLVTLALEKFRDIGVSQVRLDAASVNEPAKTLFAQCGFRPTIVEMAVELK